MRNKYIKLSIPHNGINEILQKLDKKRIIFYFDLQSISKGLYNKANIFWEINHYMENQSPSDQLVDEVRNLLNKLYMQYKNYNPFFVTFYDLGRNEQNSIISNNYKKGRTSLNEVIIDDDERYLFKKIKERYFNEIEKKCKKPNVGEVFYLHDYESDLIPYFVIDNNLYNSKHKDTLNVVFSNDKDLLQCCSFKNTIQITNNYLPSKKGNKKFEIRIWNDYNAITYIYKNFSPGILSSKYIPLILAISGDIADGIPGIKGIGFKTAIRLIENHNIPHDIDDIKYHPEVLPTKLREHYDLIIKNLKLISFKEQIKRTKILDNWRINENR